MELVINGSAVPAAEVEGKPLRDALLEVQKTKCPPGQIIVAVACDGQELPAAEMEQELSKTAGTFGKIELVTSTQEKLVAEAMAQASASLQTTEEACRQISEKLSAGNTQEGIEGLAECLQVWQQLHEAVGKSIAMLGVNPDETMIRDDTMTAVISKPLDVLGQMKQALQAQDHVLLADILQYEFAEVTEQWHAVIARLRREAEERSADSA